jgi:flavin-dependent dehydrogenase
MTEAPREAGHLVIGGGPAGSMLAIHLAAAGREVVLLEKERSAHHKVCGEFLSGEAVEYLHQAGTDPLGLGAAIIRRVRHSVGRSVVEAVLPFSALSLSRLALDEALLARAAEMGCNVQRGAFVERLTSQEGSWVAEVRGGQSWRASTVFLASGKHDLRGLEREAGIRSDMVGFKLHWRLAPEQTEALREFMDLFLFIGGYGGLSLVEADVANLCLVVRRMTLRRIGGWNDLLATLLNENPHLAQRLQDATPLWERPLAISPIPYGYLGKREEGLWRVGDQAAVIPSFTGDGMAIALHSASLAAQMFLTGETAQLYHNTLRRQLGRNMRLATGISRAMVTRAGVAFSSFGLSLFPNSMRWIASSTRIPDRLLIHSATSNLAESKLAIR